MAVRGKQYAQELEKELAKSKGLRKAHGAAIKKSVVKRTPKKKKSTWVSRLKKNVQMVIKGPKYYSSIGGKHSKKKGY